LASSAPSPFEEAVPSQTPCNSTPALVVRAFLTGKCIDDRFNDLAIVQAALEFLNISSSANFSEHFRSSAPLNCALLAFSHGHVLRRLAHGVSLQSLMFMRCSFLPSDFERRRLRGVDMAAIDQLGICR
jgi:hypothetical protein